MSLIKFINIREVTKDNYRYYYKLYVEGDAIGKLHIGKIKRTHIIGLFKKLSDERDLATGTIRYLNAFLSNCFSDALEDGLITKNPCDGALSKIEKKEPQKREALTVLQQETFINFVANSTTFNTYLPLFSFMLGTGCRIGETTGITWNDVDLKNNLISVNHTLSYRSINGKYKLIATVPKTESSIREIPIIEDLRKQLLRQREHQLMLGIPRDYEVDGYSNFVFTSSTGRPFTLETVNKVIRHIVDACNKEEQEKAIINNREPVKIPRFSAHTLRHTFCTRFCENEDKIKVIQEIMGHSKIDMTMNVYAHVSKEKAGEVMHNLSGKIKIC